MQQLVHEIHIIIRSAELFGLVINFLYRNAPIVGCMHQNIVDKREMGGLVIF